MKEKVEGTVTSWGWYRSPALDLRPYYFERGDGPAGKPLRQRPTRLRNAVEYGFDSYGDAVVERDYMLNLQACYETFTTREEWGLELSRYDYGPNKDLVSTSHLAYAGDRLQWYALRNLTEGWCETYLWDAERLLRVDVNRLEGPDVDELVLVSQYRFVYRRDRLVEIVYDLPGGSENAERYPVA